MAVSLSPIVVIPPTVNVPPIVTALGFVMVSPPLNIKVSVFALPKIRLPVLLKTTAFPTSVTLLFVPVMLTPYGLLVVVSVGVFKPPKNEIVCPLLVFVSTTLVPVLTAPVKLVPPD